VVRVLPDPPYSGRTVDTAHTHKDLKRGRR
jgi:hypothetical protein